MTDKERFKALMTDFGVKLKETGREATETLTITRAYNESNPKVIGYSGFCADFKFDAHNGKFMEVGIWK